ncbi:hypothetical protein PR048_033069 [Dryococelus australis]|uniref:Uncharacterized protein n=1 Tax=Dryococelus australis TaxID=614101 RepID=A0ABQ9FZ73_9NEOP|nr:hypothetical protein PR048_033069 [Dryococelus australis]
MLREMSRNFSEWWEVFLGNEICSTNKGRKKGKRGCRSRPQLNSMSVSSQYTLACVRKVAAANKVTAMQYHIASSGKLLRNGLRTDSASVPPGIVIGGLGFDMGGAPLALRLEGGSREVFSGSQPSDVVCLDTSVRLQQQSREFSHLVIETRSGEEPPGTKVECYSEENYGVECDSIPSDSDKAETYLSTRCLVCKLCNLVSTDCKCQQRCEALYLSAEHEDVYWRTPQLTISPAQTHSGVRPLAVICVVNHLVRKVFLVHTLELILGSAPLAVMCVVNHLVVKTILLPTEELILGNAPSAVICVVNHLVRKMVLLHTAELILGSAPLAVIYVVNHLVINVILLDTEELIRFMTSQESAPHVLIPATPKLSGRACAREDATSPATDLVGGAAARCKTGENGKSLCKIRQLRVTSTVFPTCKHPVESGSPYLYTIERNDWERHRWTGTVTSERAKCGAEQGAAWLDLALGSLLGIEPTILAFEINCLATEPWQQDEQGDDYKTSCELCFVESPLHMPLAPSDCNPLVCPCTALPCPARIPYYISVTWYMLCSSIELGRTNRLRGKETRHMCRFPCFIAGGTATPVALPYNVFLAVATSCQATLASCTDDSLLSVVPVGMSTEERTSKQTRCPNYLLPHSCCPLA